MDDQTTLREFFERYYVPDRLAGASHRISQREYRAQIAKLERYWSLEHEGPLRLADLSDELLKGAMAWDLEFGGVKGTGNTAATANKLLAHVGPVWRLAYKRRLVPTRSETEKYRVELAEPEAWLPEQEEAIWEAAESAPGRVGAVAACDWWPALLTFLGSTGLRITPTMNARCGHYDPATGEVLIDARHNKSRKAQRFDLLEGARAALDRLDPMGRGLERLFGDWPYDAGNDGWTALHRGHKKLLVRAGLWPDVESIPAYKHQFHKYRKTFGTRVASKAGKAVACELLGHSSPRVTERYIDTRQVQRTRIADVLGDVGVGRGPGPRPDGFPDVLPFRSA